MSQQVFNLLTLLHFHCDMKTYIHLIQRWLMFKDKHLWSMGLLGQKSWSQQTFNPSLMNFHCDNILKSFRHTTFIFYRNVIVYKRKHL